MKHVGKAVEQYSTAKPNQKVKRLSTNIHTLCTMTLVLINVQQSSLLQLLPLWRFSCNLCRQTILQSTLVRENRASACFDQ